MIESCCVFYFRGYMQKIKFANKLQQTVCVFLLALFRFNNLQLVKNLAEYSNLTYQQMIIAFTFATKSLLFQQTFFYGNLVNPVHVEQTNNCQSNRSPNSFVFACGSELIVNRTLCFNTIPNFNWKFRNFKLNNFSHHQMLNFKQSVKPFQSYLEFQPDKKPIETLNLNLSNFEFQLVNSGFRISNGTIKKG